MKNIGLKLIVVVGLCFSGQAFSALYFSQDGNGDGLFEIDISTGAATPVGISGVTGSTVGLAPSTDPAMLYGSRWSSLLEIQADGSGAVDLGGDGQEGLAYCASNDTLYGVINGSFTSVNYSTGVNIATLAAPGFDMEGIACDPATNTIYGVGNSTLLMAYDIGAGSWSTVGDIGINLNQGGLAFDPSGVLYAIGQGTADSLITIDPITAVAVTVGPLGTTAEGGLAWVGPGAVASESIPVPTLSTWALLLLVISMGFVVLRRDIKIRK